MRERPTIGTAAATTARPDGLSRGKAAVPSATATPACPDRYPSPEASRPRVWVPLTSAAGRGRAHHLFDQLGQGPGARAAREQAARKRAVVRQQRCACCRGRGAERAQLHDDPDGTVERVGQAVDGPERLGLALPHPFSARRQCGDQYRCRAQAESAPGIGQPAHGRTLSGLPGPLRRCWHGGQFRIAGTGEPRHGLNSKPSFFSPGQESIARLGRTGIAVFKNAAAAKRHRPGTAVPVLFMDTGLQSAGPAHIHRKAASTRSRRAVRANSP